MKTIFSSLIALAVGIAVGVYTSYREFEDERLPTKSVLAVLAERDSGGVPGDGPKVIVEGGEIHDFGTMDRGSKDKHDFVFRNVGTKPLEITMGETTCKCTAMSVEGKSMTKGDKQSIGPGDSFTVTLEWAIRTTQEKFSQSAEFTTNDPRRDIVRLLIHGKTVEAVELGDSTVSFEGIPATESAIEELSIYSHRDEELKITKHVWQDFSSKDFLEATFTPMSSDEAFRHGAKGGVTMRVALKPGLPVGITRQMISLTTNYDGIENQVVPVRIRIVGDINLLGPRVAAGATSVVLGTIDQKTGMTHTVYLHIKGPYRDMTNIEVERAEPASLRATLEPPLTDIPNVKRIPIKIEVPAGAALGNYLGPEAAKTGRIVLKTTHPDFKQIVIPVYFLVR